MGEVTLYYRVLRRCVSSISSNPFTRDPESAVGGVGLLLSEQPPHRDTGVPRP